MKTLIGTAVLSMMVMGALPSQASAWYCRAVGTAGASGWATSSSLPSAQARALAECAVRTPRGHVCYITACS
jgi:hypothetical protein